MGYFVDGYCHPDLLTAENIWCASVEPGSTFASCRVVSGTPQVTFFNGSVFKTYIYHPPLSSCDPATDNLNLIDNSPMLIGAVAVVLATAWGFRRVVDLLRGPHE